MTEITFWSLSVVLSALIPCAACAKTQEANCTDSSYGWAFNSLGLSPCRVAKQLALPCNINVSITQLPNTSYAYFGPPAGEADPCRCSSVYYSLLAGCAACQDANWMRWNSYTQNCSTVYLEIFPSPIPSGTKVPHWAYLNVSTEGEFDPTEAAAGGRVRSFDASVENIIATVASSDAAAAGSSGTHSVSPGVIAGAVIGSLVGVASIACLLLFFYKGRKPNKRVGLSSQNGGPAQEPLSISPFPLAMPTMLRPLTGKPAAQLSDPLQISPIVPLRSSPSTSDLTSQEPQRLARVMHYTGAAEV